MFYIYQNTYDNVMTEVMKIKGLFDDLDGDIVM